MVLLGLDLAFRPTAYLASAGTISLPDSAHADDKAACREIRSGYIVHELVRLYFRIVNDRNRCVHDLSQVMRRDIRGHADRDSSRAVYEKVRKARRQRHRLHKRLVIVGIKIDRILIDIAKHFHRDLVHSRLGIPHCCRAVAVN